MEDDFPSDADLDAHADRGDMLNRVTKESGLLVQDTDGYVSMPARELLRQQISQVAGGQTADLLRRYLRLYVSTQRLLQFMATHTGATDEWPIIVKAQSPEFAAEYSRLLANASLCADMLTPGLSKGLDDALGG